MSGLLSNPQLTWYLTRASGIVALALLTMSMVLGIVAGTRLSSTRWPRFVTQGLHRNISLFVLVLLALHVGAAVIDDVLGLVVLAIVSKLAQGGALGPGVALKAAVLAIGFLVAAVVI